MYLLDRRYAIAIALEAQEAREAQEAQEAQETHHRRGYAIAAASLELVAPSPPITAIRDSFLNATVASSAIPASACRARELSPHSSVFRGAGWPKRRVRPDSRGLPVRAPLGMGRW